MTSKIYSNFLITNYAENFHLGEDINLLELHIYEEPSGSAYRLQGPLTDMCF